MFEAEEGLRVEKRIRQGDWLTAEQACEALGIPMFCRTDKEVISYDPKGGLYGRIKTTVQQGIQDRSGGITVEERETSNTDRR